MSETRALTAALSGPAFHGAATRSALHASERHVSRWAPEGAAATRSGGMRSLGFADRIAAPWMSAAMQSRGAQMMARPTADRGTPEVSWLFPRPWFQDELDWMAAARQGAEAAPTFLTTRGTYASSRQSMSDIAMPMLTADQVAPSMARPAMPSSSASSFGDAGSSMALPAGMPAGFAQVQHSLRTFSPVVPFAAASAAEVVAGTIGMATQSGLATVATGSSGRSPILSGLTVVAPSALTPIEAPSARFAAPAPAAERVMPTTTRVLFEAAKAQVARVEEARQAPSNVIPFAAPSADVSPEVAASAPSAGETVAPAAPTAETIADRSIAEASTASPDVARALRTVDLLFQAARPAETAAPSTAAPVSYAAPAPRASSFEPAAGPRVAMPVGLGGLVTALDAQSLTSAPLARMTAAPAVSPAAPPFAPTLARVAAYAAEAARFETPSAPPSTISSPIAGAPSAMPMAAPSFAPVWASAQGSTALGSIAAERAKAVDHMAWSDRWLARFAGASPVALAALDATRESPAPEMRARQVLAPDQIYLQPPMPAPALAAAIRGSVLQPVVEAGPGPARVQPAAPARATRVDDTAPVSDDIFAAIAAAAAAPAPQQRPQVLSPREEQARREAAAVQLAEARPLTPADVVRAGARPTLADLVAISPPPAPDAGLSPGLASSPLAPAMAGVLPLPAAPTFDPRALFPEAVSSAYLGGFLARSAAPIGVVSSEPTMRALVSAASFASSNPLASAAMAPAAGAGTTAASMGAGDEAATPFAFGGAGAMPMVAPWMAAARAWSARDLTVAPPSLRLADAAPARVILSADVESDRRASIGPAFAPSTIAAASAAAVQRAAVAPDAAIDAPLAAPSVDADIEPPSAEVAAPGLAPAADVPAAPAFAPLSPAIEAELLTLRAALFAAPGPTSTPLAFADHLPLLSAPTHAPAAPLTPAATAPAMTYAGAPASLAAELALDELTLPSATATSAAPVGARSLALPSVGGGATLGAGLPAGMFPAATAAAAAAETSFGGEAPAALGAASSFGALQAPTPFGSSGRPGSLAEMILAWSVAEERSAANLAFDFVQPEMVLAAKVYGLSPAAAAQASRLAIAGPGAIASLATSVDLTFLRGFQQLHAQQEQPRAGSPSSPTARGAAPTSARGDEPTAPPDLLAPSYAGPGAAPLLVDATGAPVPMSPAAIEAAAQAQAAAAAPTQAQPPGAAPIYGSPSYGAPSSGGEPYAPPQPSLATEILGGARLPRGAFLWPEATVAALGLRAQSPDGVAGMPVVALELLAAAAVADLGTWVTTFAPSERQRLAGALRASGLAPAGAAAFAPGAMPMVSAQPGVPGAAVPGATVGPSGEPIAPTSYGQAAALGSPMSPTAVATAAAAESEAGAADVLAPELATAPVDMRARFEAIYIALAQTGEGQTLSPSARAARAMALLARSDGGAAGLGAMSPRERALTAWSVMPQVFQGDLDLVAPAAPRAGDDTQVESRPGLAGLAARAGESLASFVSPTSSEVSSWTTETFPGFNYVSPDSGGSSSSAASFGDRSTGTAPVYVSTGSSSSSSSSGSPTVQNLHAAMSRPGRAFAQTGGGEPEIPSWFEAAARMALEQRSPGSGMSMAELVLVTAAATPSRAIAAATRGAAPTAAPQQVQGAGDKGSQEGEKPEVDKLAHEVYLEVLKLIDIARMRSGDPFQ